MDNVCFESVKVSSKEIGKYDDMYNSKLEEIKKILINELFVKYSIKIDIKNNYINKVNE